MRIIDRDSAIEEGLVRFFTGVPCKHGHTSDRYTLSGGCVTCMALKVERRHQKIKNRILEIRNRKGK